MKCSPIPRSFQLRFKCGMSYFPPSSPPSIARVPCRADPTHGSFHPSPEATFTLPETLHDIVPSSKGCVYPGEGEQLSCEVSPMDCLSAPDVCVAAHTAAAAARQREAPGMAEPAGMGLPEAQRRQHSFEARLGNRPANGASSPAREQCPREARDFKSKWNPLFLEHALGQAKVEMPAL